MNVIKNLQKWYLEQCDGKWEHGYGIKIDTLDNPGWVVKIDLADTKNKNLKMEKIKIEHDTNDWYVCEIKNNQFIGCGDPSKLEKILDTFLKVSH